MGFTSVPQTVLGVTLVASLALPGCAEVRNAITSHLDTPTAEEYIAQVRSKTQPKVSAGATKTEGVLTVGLCAQQTTPHVIVDKDNRVDGLDVDLACALADELGLKVRFLTVADVRSGLEKSCDIVMGAEASKCSGYPLLGDYDYSAVALFRKGTDASRATADQVRAARIGAQEGSYAQIAMRMARLDSNETLYPSLTEAFDALSRGEVDFVTCNASVGKYLGVIKGNTSIAGTLDAPSAMSIAVAAGKDELTSAVSEAYKRIQTNGVLSATQRPWIGSNATILPDMQLTELTNPAAAQTPAPQEQPAQPEAAPAV